MKEIKLTQGQIALVDDEDYNYLNQFNWFVHKIDDIFYAERNGIDLKGSKIIIRMHRIIMNTPQVMSVDHINHNGLDNRKSNLRSVTNQQNCMNRRKQKNCSSQYKGVSILRKNKKQNIYEAKIGFNRIKTRIGTFKDAVDAAKAYDKRAKELFGEFANLNFK